MFSDRFICASDRVCDYDAHVPAPLFRKSFTVDTLPTKASLTVCGLGFYELYVNGQKMTNGALTPYISNPDDFLYYDYYDISCALHTGENVLGFMLGNGFFNSFDGFMWDYDKAPWNGPLRLAFSLELEDAAGKRIIEADETVKVAESPITFDALRIGTFYDARREIAGWNRPDFDDSLWASAKPAARPQGEARISEAEAVTMQAEIKPQSIQHFDDFCFCCESNVAYEDPIELTRVKDTYVYDFGENNSGVCRLKIRGEEGQRVTLRFGEMMVDGRFTLRSTIFIRPGIDRYLTYPQMDVFTLKGEGEECFTPPFTYHGFRYVLVEGITPEQATEDLLTYLVMSSDIPERGEFSCSDDTLNRLFDMTRRSDRSNFVFFPTDCPHREKNGWTGDASLSAEHMLMHMAADNSLREWMRSIRKAQRKDGALPGLVPTSGWGFEWGNGPAWDRVCVYLPYYCYQYDGDTRIIEENADLIERYLRYINGRRDERGLVAVGLGDWLQPYRDGDIFLSPLEFTDSAIVLDLARKAAYLLRAIGREEAASYADALAARMRCAIREHLIDLNTMTVVGECQTSQVMAISYDILQEDEKPAAVEKLIEYIHAADDHLVCGMLGGRHIFHVLADYGYADLAVKMILDPQPPSYGAWVVEGQTTLCESFALPGERADSRNHHCWGDIGSFFMQRLAGLRANPYVRDIREYAVEPQFVQALTHAQAHFDSPYGRVAVAWERTDDGICLQVTAPDEIYGSIRLPRGYCLKNGARNCALHSGVYTVKTAE